MLQTLGPSTALDRSSSSARTLERSALILMGAYGAALALRADWSLQPLKTKLQATVLCALVLDAAAARELTPRARLLLTCLGYGLTCASLRSKLLPVAHVTSLDALLILSVSLAFIAAALRLQGPAASQTRS